MNGNKFILSHLSYFDSLSPATVEDGSKFKVQGLGHTHPVPNLSLDYGLDIPGCPFNLIFIKKLTRTLACSILLIDKSA